MQVSLEPAYLVQTVTDASSFLALEREWNEAVERAGVRHPFFHHEWLRTWWECFGGDRHLHVLVVRDFQGIVALAPLMRERTRMYGVAVRQLCFLANDHTPRADMVVTRQSPGVYDAIWNALHDRRHEWDTLLLNQLPVDSPTRRHLSGLAESEGCVTGGWPADDSPYLELQHSWADYLQNLTPKFRANVRNRIGRLERLGSPSLEVLRGDAAIAACEESLRLEASGWKRSEGTAICSNPDVHRFYVHFARRAAARDWLRILFLSVAGRRIASSYALQYGNRLFLCKTGYDPAYAGCSPFKVLTYFAIRHAYEHGLAEIDFLGKSEPWKREWTRPSRPHEWRFIFARRAKTRALAQLKLQVAPVWHRWREAR